jgi:hypothetical protein
MRNCQLLFSFRRWDQVLLGTTVVFGSVQHSDQWLKFRFNIFITDLLAKYKNNGTIFLKVYTAGKHV